MNLDSSQSWAQIPVTLWVPSDQRIIQLRDPQDFQAMPLWWGLDSSLQPWAWTETESEGPPSGQEEQEKEEEEGTSSLPPRAEWGYTGPPRRGKPETFRMSGTGLNLVLCLTDSLLEYLPQWGTHYHSGARKLLTAQALEQTNTCARVCVYEWNFMVVVGGGSVQSLSHVWLCNPMDCSLPGSSVHGILQAIILEWVVISFSRGSSPPKDQTHIFCISRQILYHWATREAHKWNQSIIQAYHKLSEGLWY